MLFNSIDFAVFLPCVFFCYWLLNGNLKQQNLFVLVASYIFYGWWDYRFTGLLLFSTLTDYFIGLSLGREQEEKRRKILLWVSIGVNIGFLFCFKYFNFFLDNFVEAFSFFGKEFSKPSLYIILPVGISFYTFQTLSYTIDIYKRKLEPTKDFVAFGAFVSFFPQLVAGPIERATHLLPQFFTQRRFDYSNAVNGMKQILWGGVKKLVIADNCAHFADLTFNHMDEYSGSSLVLGAFFFTLQIYGDFSGYSDIAIGTARLFGFTLRQNFAFPYFSRDIAEFWRRWHISLTTWFRDYIYIPLGGSRGNIGLKVRNTFVVFLVSGFWHGANWTFIVWGLLNALYFLPLLLTHHNRKNLDIVAKDRILPTLSETLQMFVTFSLTVFAWIFFRAADLPAAFDYINRIFSSSLFTIPRFETDNRYMISLLVLIFLFTFVEWVGRRGQYAIETIGKVWPTPLKWVFYLLILFFIVLFMPVMESPFIYFQF